MGCTISEKKAVSCCRSCGSTVRVVSMPTVLLGSVPLHHVNAEQHVTELPPLCARLLMEVAVSLSCEKLSLVGGVERAPRG